MHWFGLKLPGRGLKGYVSADRRLSKVRNSELPVPPVDALAGSAAAWTFMGANIVAAMAAFIWAATWIVRKRDRTPLYCLAGGFLAMFATEPILDRLMLVWYPVNSPLIAAHLYGTPMPLYLLIGYPWYVGLGAFVVHRAVDSGITATGLWRVFAAIAVLDVVIELPSTAAGVHIYFGPQPNFFHHGLAITIPFVMSAVSLGCGFAVHRLLSVSRTAWTFAAVMAIIPSTAVAVLVGTQWPIMLAQNSAAPSSLLWISAVISIALVFAGMRAAIATLVTTRDTQSPRHALDGAVSA
jgi:hypothetical protein